MLCGYARGFINEMEIIRARVSYVIRKNAHAREKKKKKICRGTRCVKWQRVYTGGEFYLKLVLLS